jgi:ParB family chromosome partitioning protein
MDYFRIWSLRKPQRGQYAVVAGERRLLAMIQLAENGTYK